MPSSATRFQDLDPRVVSLTMTGVLIAIFMGSLDQTIVATAMPVIATSLHGFGSYSAVVTAYLIASTVALPLGGKLSDVYGRKRFLIGGMLWFVVASMACGFAQSMAQLIFYRALKGFGAGVMQSAASTTIADLFPPIRRGKAIGLISTVSVLANVIGPLLGGYLTDGPGWRYVFFLNLPVGLIGALVVARYFPRVQQAKVKDFRIDYLGALTLIAGMVPILVALHNVGESNQWLAPNAIGLLTLGLVFLVVFLWVEKRAAHPIVPLHVFKNSIISISLFNTGVSMAALFGVSFFVPLFLQSVLGASAKESGKILLPLSITFATTATASGMLVGYLGRYRNLAAVGAAISVVGGYLLATMTPHTSHAALLGSTVLTGFGLALCVPLYNLAVQNAAQLSVLGVTTSMVYFMRSIGSSIGVAAYGTILTSQTKSYGLPTALSSVFWLVTGLNLAILIATCFLKEIPLRKSNAVAPAIEAH